LSSPWRIEGLKALSSLRLMRNFVHPPPIFLITL
jgi:hypothetical protein